jgi:hypothetical protein
MADQERRPTGFFFSRWITKDWLVWGGGRLTLCLSVCAILGLTVCLYALPFVHVNVQKLMSESALIRTMANAFGVVGAAGAMLVYVSMWFYWGIVDQSGRMSKTIWFLVMLLGLWYGSCLYYFLVYLPQVSTFRRGAYR